MQDVHQGQLTNAIKIKGWSDVTHEPNVVSAASNSFMLDEGCIRFCVFPPAFLLICSERLT